ncbi:MAG TPA: gamma-glutamyltransferase [Vicinamibacterales bacterium]|nr:gamma-glutamyltransferase [Vicinamibacterales bacterium]
MTRRRPPVAVLLLLVLVVLSPFTSQPSGQTSTWRPAILADRGMVASGHPLASEAGLRILRSGGNAVDAAIAAWAVQGVTEPEMTGLGGDMFALIYIAKTGEVKFINGTGPAATAATVEFYKSKGGLPSDGALSVIVPGAVGGAELAVQKYGTKPLAELFTPAVELADSGFPVTESLAGALRSNKEKLGRVPASKKIWFKGDEPLAMGDRVVQKDLAATLRTIGAKGSAEFYRGATGAKIVSHVKGAGGIIETSDLAGYSAHEDAPIHINYKGVEVYECPPNSQGFVMLQALNILEGLNVRYLRYNSAPYLHAVAESLKLAFADRNRYVGDPRFVPGIPMRELLSKEYAAQRRALINPDRAIEGEAPAGTLRSSSSSASAAGLRYSTPRPAPVVDAGAPASPDGHTTYLAVVDKDRNMVSITSSLLSLFGSGHVAEGTGIMLNNRMAYFSLDADDVNRLEPRKRVRHTINPALALKEGKPYLVFGTPGADTQPQAQLQFFLNVVEFGMNVQQALEQPAVISSSFRGSYYPHSVEGKLQVPASLPKHVLDELAALGHDLDVRNVRGVGSVKAIIVHPRTGVLMGGVSPTRDSYVMGW